MQEPAFVRVALDPTLIKGIYDTCDQWCMYCPATNRCLAFRCNPDLQHGKQNVYRSMAHRLFEGMMFLKCLCEAEGRPTPEIDAMLSDDPRRRATLVEIDDPLEKKAQRYALVSRAYLTSRPDYPFEMRPRPSGPTPFEVFAWFHVLIAAKIYRALVSSADAVRGMEGRRQDALMSAKVALIGIDRSLDALAAMAVELDDPRHQLLQSYLRRLRREVEARFPEARRVVRAGLDDEPSSTRH